jgi:molybdate transport system substrate-binding protein
MIITLFSGIVPIRGVEILGPLPGDLHYEIRLAAAVSATAQNADAAKALIGLLAGPKVMQLLEPKAWNPSE